jgi:exodeoxyribonuclease VII small subunit
MFKEELERLEAIVRALEQEDLDLDRALALFEEGVTRLKTARELLQQSELTVKRVLEAADGTLRSDRAEL